MSWTTITTEDVLAEFTPVETATLQSIQGAADNLAGILTKAVKAARSQINAGGNQLDNTGLTVPDALVEDVIAVARWRWLSSFPALKTLKTAEREKAHRDAVALLKEISSQKADRPRTELPATADGAPMPLIQPRVGRPKLGQFRPRFEDGII